MGHYDSCYEADWEREKPERERREKEEILKIQKMLDKHGITKTLYLLKKGY